MLELQLEPKRNTFRDDVFVMLKMWLNFMQEVFWTNKHTAKVGLRCNSLCKYMQYGSLHTNITYLVYFFVVLLFWSVRCCTDRSWLFDMLWTNRVLKELSLLLLMNSPTRNVVKTCWNSHIWASLCVVFRPARRAAIAYKITKLTYEIMHINLRIDPLNIT